MQYILMCKSLTYAQRSAKLLERAGVTGVVSRAPAGAAKKGCAYCVKVSKRAEEKALRLLRESELAPERVFAMEEDGTLTEVER